MLAILVLKLWLAANPGPHVVDIVTADGVDYAVVCEASGCDLVPVEELY